MTTAVKLSSHRGSVERGKGWEETVLRECKVGVTTAVKLSSLSLLSLFVVHLGVLVSSYS